MRPADVLVPTGSGVTAVTRAEPEPPDEAARVPGRREGAGGSAAGASTSTPPLDATAAGLEPAEVSTAWLPASAGASAGFDSTASSLLEPGRWRKPMRTAPKPTAASARTTTPTIRSTPPLFWPPPVSSALAAILVPLLLVARRGRRARLRRVPGVRGGRPRRRCRVEAVRRCRELGHGRAGAVVLVVRGQLQVRDGHDAAHVRQLREERAHRVVVTRHRNRDRHLGVEIGRLHGAGAEHRERDAGLLAGERDLAQQRRQLALRGQQLGRHLPALVELFVLGLEARQVRDRGARARELGGLLLVLGLELGDVLAALGERERQEMREEVDAQRAPGEEDGQQELL